MSNWDEQLDWKVTLVELIGIKPEPGYYDPPTPEFAEQVRLQMEGFLGNTGLQPCVVPLQKGGIQFEWHQNGQDFEIEFLPGKQPYADWNGGLEQAKVLLTGLLGDPVGPKTDPAAKHQPPSQEETS